VRLLKLAVLRQWLLLASYHPLVLFLVQKVIQVRKDLQETMERKAHKESPAQQDHQVRRGQQVFRGRREIQERMPRQLQQCSCVQALAQQYTPPSFQSKRFVLMGNCMAFTTMGFTH
jgi:hypothetical protein